MTGIGLLGTEDFTDEKYIHLHNQRNRDRANDPLVNDPVYQYLSILWNGQADMLRMENRTMTEPEYNSLYLQAIQVASEGVNIKF